MPIQSTVSLLVKDARIQSTVLGRGKASHKNSNSMDAGQMYLSTVALE